MRDLDKLVLGKDESLLTMATGTTAKGWEANAGRGRCRCICICRCRRRVVLSCGLILMSGKNCRYYTFDWYLGSF